MLKILILIVMLSLITSCYGNDNQVYSKKLNIFINSDIYDVDKIENNIVVLISRDLKKVRKIKLSFFKKEIKEGDMVSYVDNEVYINKNNKLKSRIMKLQFELNKENQKLSLNL